MAKKKKGPVKSIMAGLDLLIENSEKEAEKGSKFYRSHLHRASRITDDWRYIDFYDVARERANLPMEWLYGTRGFLTGRTVNYLSGEAAGKSSMLFLNIAMAQKTTGVWALVEESEDTPPPPDFVYSLGCNPEELLYEFPHSVDMCHDNIHEFVKKIRDAGLDPEKKYPIFIGVDSVSGLADNLLKEDGVTTEEDGGSLGYHARAWSDFFRDHNTTLANGQTVLFAASQRKAAINTGPMPTGGSGPTDSSLAENAFAFHATHRVRLSHSRAKDKNTGADIGEKVTMRMFKNKLAPNRRWMNLLMRRAEDVPKGEPCWDFTDTNKDVLFGLASPFKQMKWAFNGGNGGWYSHEAIQENKSLRLPEFLDAFYENETLVMEVREVLKIRGFGFKFETDYMMPEEEPEMTPEDIEKVEEAADAETTG